MPRWLRLSFLVFALLLGSLPSSWGAISFLQAANGDFVVATASLNASFASGVTAGSIVAACGSFDSATTSVTAADDKGDQSNTVVAVYTVSTFNAKAACFAFYTPTAGAKVFTFSFTGTNPTFGDFFIWEIAGLTNAGADKTNHGDANGGTVANSGATGTLSTANEAVIGYGTTSDGFNGTVAAGFTSDGTSPHTGSIGAHQVVAATTSLTFTANIGNPGATSAIIATFQSVSSGGGGTGGTLGLFGVGQ